MVALGRGVFLMSEVPLYAPHVGWGAHLALPQLGWLTILTLVDMLVLRYTSVLTAETCWGPKKW